ncbi:MAG: trimethylamine methyltransferase family protein [Chloroflexota bacterium]|nr:MAG: trimethylamine methyltransferase family protein [Chloroflexota bacterium]
MVSFTPDILSFHTDRRINILSSEQVETLKSGTLQVLAEVGVHFPSRRALGIFADHSAWVDWEREIVKIPPDLVEKGMSTAPRTFTLAGREPRFDLLLDGKRSYLATDGCGVKVFDIESQQLRPSKKDDVATMARVCDSLPMVSFFWPLVSAQDHGLAAPLHECHAGLTNTLKHVRGGTTAIPQIARHIVEMATVVAGSQEALRQRPPICANICTIAPLGHDQDGIEAGLIYAEAGIPTSYMAMPTMGSTAPATPLGALTTGDAEVVSAMVLVQLLYPGAPVFHSVLVSLMDPRTGGYISDLPLPLNYIAVQLAHAWKVPSLGGGSLSSDAQDIGWQSGTSSGMGALQVALAGGEVCGYLGMLGGSMILSPEQIILDHEISQNAFDLLHGFEFKEEDIALDVIAAVGPGDHYLLQKHTRQHIRDFRLSGLLRQKDEGGKWRDPRQVAQEEFKRRTASHQPEPLNDDLLAELDSILQAAEMESQQLRE